MLNKDTFSLSLEPHRESRKTKVGTDGEDVRFFYVSENFRSTVVRSQILLKLQFSISHEMIDFAFQGVKF